MAKLTKKDVISYVKTQAGINENQANKSVNALIELIQARVAAGDQVILTGFGTFSAVEAAERVATNPNTKEKIKVPSKMRPKFHAGNNFKAAVEAGPQA